ncbi:MAG: lipase [Oceanospirillaceae bacterium]|uniref:lipase family alpha/beta hydrolase n=2 Tax=unclassified Thalassolituus TaxID=2624967 RepID=UPI000C4B4DE7|nr:triacylglycerol lipase [Thalassolituus sp. UBA6592]MAS25119.1 lipase [Oceanospirillaceae bacterium]MBL36291.1 lipase [Oceanospirillaceae bacterium]MBS53978.1 lipase [Oceanospirillaceae bacterium]|tara:strand:- start:7803 stop:8744 length:942 start_codon:yes stop_codon:yes gene_type:complete
MKKLMTIAALLSMTLSFHVSAMSAAPETGYTETRYPIVLVHGFLGWDTMLGIDYWYQITEALQEGGADVYVVTVPNANTPEVRGEELIPQIEEILALTGAQRVNLIGHSHGGPTTRYVASVRPELVASVTSVSGVNKGTPIADTLIATAEDSAAFDAIFGGIVNLAAEALNLISGADYDDVNAMIAIASMTSERAVVFNQQHPGGIPDSACGEGDYEYNGVRYYSWAGADPTTVALDPMDLITVAFSQFFPEGQVNDGFVGACDAHLGMVIRDDFVMNHLDEINQFLGLHDINETDPVAVYRTHANRLKSAGL